MRRIALLVLLASIAAADTSHRPSTLSESSWRAADFAAATNDPWTELVTDGGVASLKITGHGESCLLRRRRIPFADGLRIAFRVRVSQPAKGSAYPSLHVVLDPPALDDPWWALIAGDGFQQRRWPGGVRVFLFHFPDTNLNWSQMGVSGELESGPHRHQYVPALDRWIWLEVRFLRGEAIVSADDREVAHCPADLTGVRTVAWGVGDQTSTRVELDAVRIRPR